MNRPHRLAAAVAAVFTTFTLLTAVLSLADDPPAPQIAAATPTTVVR